MHALSLTALALNIVLAIIFSSAGEERLHENVVPIISMGKLSAGKLCRFSPQIWSFSFRFVLELRAIEIDPTDPPKVTDVTATERRISSAKRSQCSTRPSLTRFRRGMRRLTGNMGVKKCTRLNWWAFLHRIFGKIHPIRVFALPFLKKVLNFSPRLLTHGKEIMLVECSPTVVGKEGSDYCFLLIV